ncbi:MAG TPA: redox-sensing transcriptional repressor Rex [Candidatus Goldiibacteriota bacterium]|jgi:redox-sensing transcriptional repressor|nr:redox-sensing transcriptional repressor Rex [Candidatus Goldiibacteriota bacterium]HPI04211.1 redox-sensing transcriptional repressor Rex [Candidatus Goldiibacteriota bacterium]HPN64804.1 redox-sensing transcriptional repressor Rex [Candidatus Goldiibacteriota bacterium]HRQ43467.1 redox-sensing transcriptional repressor Rex [Candidatus Goldiibacteriota bacterium]
MTQIDRQSIPVPTLRRMPAYCNYLKSLSVKGIVYVSTTAVANDLNLIPIQVRKDFEYTRLSGKPKIGYNLELLIEAIEYILGWNKMSNAVIAGVGNLGKALLSYQGFKNYGLDIIAGIDQDKKKHGKEVAGRKVYPPEQIGVLVKENKIGIGIITVPAESAQLMADLFVKNGITALWNFAPVRLNVPADVVVQNENLASSLAVLSQRIKQQKEK